MVQMHVQGSHEASSPWVPSGCFFLSLFCCWLVLSLFFSRLLFSLWGPAGRSQINTQSLILIYNPLAIVWLVSSRFFLNYPICLYYSSIQYIFLYFSLSDLLCSWVADPWHPLPFFSPSSIFFPDFSSSSLSLPAISNCFSLLPTYWLFSSLLGQSSVLDRHSNATLQS